MNEKQASFMSALIIMVVLFVMSIAADLLFIREQITEIRSQPQTYCIKYKPMGE